jgi:hypothetical protein
MSVQSSFDSLTPVHMLATMVGWSFEELLTAIVRFGAERTYVLLDLQRLDLVAMEANQWRHQVEQQKATGRLGGTRNKSERARNIVITKKLLREYVDSEELQSKHKTPTGYIEARLQVSDRTARSCLKEISGK